MRQVATISQLTRRLLAAAVVLALATCAESATGPGGSTRTELAAGEETTGSLTAGGRVEYLLSAPKDAMLFIALQARSGRIADTVVATVADAQNDAILATLVSAGSQPRLYDVVAELPAAAQERDLIITVKGAQPTVVSPFTLVANPLGTTPERSSATLTAGQTVSEALDVAGDTDEFTLQGAAGNVIWIQVAADAPFSDGLSVELFDGSTRLGGLTTSDAQTTLNELSTVPVAFPRSGAFTIRVRAGDGTASNNTGGYRLRFSAITPESLPLPGDLELRRLQLDSLVGPDSVDTWEVGWSTVDQPMGFSLEVMDAEPNDSLIATFTAGLGGDSAGTLVAVTGGGPVIFEGPLRPEGPATALIATVRAKRYAARAVYRMRLGSSTSDAPESVPALIVPGDTLEGESFGDKLDIDRYFLDAGPADAEWIVMLVPDSARADKRTSLIVRDRSDQLVEEIALSAATTQLEMTATYLQLQPDRGPFSFTVFSGGFPGEWKGTYRMRIARVDRGTETATTQVAPGDTISSAIEQPGDIDNYELNVVEGDEMYFHYGQFVPGVDQAFSLYDGTSYIERLVLPDYALPFDEQDAHFLWRAPRTGTFTLQMRNGQNYGLASNWPTPYTIEIQRVERAPESIPGTGWAWADTIRGEMLERRGDVDEFFVTFDSTRMMRIVLVAHRADGMAGVRLTVHDSTGGERTRLGLALGDAADTITVDAHEEFFPGTYRFQLQSTDPAPVPFEVYMAPSYIGPESINDTLPLGTWVSGEAVDSIGDLDRYVVHVDSGVAYLAEIEKLPGASGGFAFYVGESSASTYGQNGVGVAPATGWIDALVDWSFGIEGRPLGPYRMRVSALDPMPETAPSVIAIGDTVDTEAIDLITDEDRFTFQGTAGTVIRVTVQLASFPDNRWASVRLVVPGVDTYWLETADGTAEDYMLPVTGTYTLIIQGGRDVGPYFLSVIQPY